VIRLRVVLVVLEPPHLLVVVVVVALLLLALQVLRLAVLERKRRLLELWWTV
jgi:hypothetical protein